MPVLEQISLWVCGCRTVTKVEIGQEGAMSKRFAVERELCRLCRADIRKQIQPRGYPDLLQNFRLEIATYDQEVLLKANCSKYEELQLCSLQDLTLTHIQRIMELVDQLDEYIIAMNDVDHELYARKRHLSYAVAKSSPNFINEMSLPILMSQTRLTIDIVEECLDEFVSDLLWKRRRETCSRTSRVTQVSDAKSIRSLN
jgi:hypothetical protein